MKGVEDVEDVEGVKDVSEKVRKYQSCPARLLMPVVRPSWEVCGERVPIFIHHRLRIHFSGNYLGNRVPSGADSLIFSDKDHFY